MRVGWCQNRPTKNGSFLAGDRAEVEITAGTGYLASHDG